MDMKGHKLPGKQKLFYKGENFNFNWKNFRRLSEQYNGRFYFLF